jgi:hypothetical protein
MSEAAKPHLAHLPSEPCTMPISPALLLWLTRVAFEIANRAVVEDIESYAAKEVIDGRTWWDTRPMTDPREFRSASVDIADLAIAYAIGAGLARLHPQRPYLLAIASRS